MKCLVCNSDQFSSNLSLARHLQMCHKMKCEEYTLRFLFNVRPVCRCNYGEYTRYSNFSYKKFKQGHNSIGSHNNWNIHGLSQGKLRWAQFRRGKSHEEIFGNKSTEIRAKTRKTFIAYLKKTGKFRTIVGKNETKLLDLQEQIDNCKIKRQFSVKNLHYIVDGYCPETNTVYEVYENAHLKTSESDEKRQREIQNCLNCNFIIIRDK